MFIDYGLCFMLESKTELLITLIKVTDFLKLISTHFRTPADAQLIQPFFLFL